jgi:Lysophospholipase L1 and related esterases
MFGAMQIKNKKIRLFIRRTIVCICGAGILYLLAAGAAAVINGISMQIRPQEVQAAPSAAGQAVSMADAAQKLSVPAAASDEEDFDGALFIGDSRTEGLENYNGLQGARYYAVKGLMVNTVYTKPAVESGGEKVTVMQALRKDRFSRVYVMLGVNELGWSNTDKFIEDYTKMIEDIKQYQPQAKIFLQSILPVSEKKSVSDKIYNNNKIAAYNAEIEKIAEKENVYYLKVNTAVSDSGGYLPEEASSDGVHLNRKYIKIWCDYLRAHI